LSAMAACNFLMSVIFYPQISLIFADLNSVVCLFHDYKP